MNLTFKNLRPSWEPQHSDFNMQFIPIYTLKGDKEMVERQRDRGGGRR